MKGIDSGEDSSRCIWGSVLGRGQHDMQCSPQRRLEIARVFHSDCSPNALCFSVEYAVP